MLDVNYLDNIESNSLPTGYGAYVNNSELDVLNSITEGGVNDIDRQRNKELQFEIQAKKIINKYN